ncbi:MAG: DUF721 domain-containing protein [Nitrosomonas sp.]|nr:MAG: DUF721 domain-containing protein [Nitrosomonas sp.]
MTNSFRRNPKGYDGPRLTTHHASDVAPVVLRGITASLQECPDVVLTAWAGIIGPKLVSMAEAVSFVSGILVVRVKNSTFYSLLSQRDKPRLLKTLRMQLPSTTIHDIVFRMS